MPSARRNDQCCTARVLSHCSVPALVRGTNRRAAARTDAMKAVRSSITTSRDPSLGLRTSAPEHHESDNCQMMRPLPAQVGSSCPVVAASIDDHEPLGVQHTFGRSPPTRQHRAFVPSASGSPDATRLCLARTWTTQCQPAPLRFDRGGGSQIAAHRYCDAHRHRL